MPASPAPEGKAGSKASKILMSGCSLPDCRVQLTAELRMETTVSVAWVEIYPAVRRIPSQGAAAPDRFPARYLSSLIPAFTQRVGCSRAPRCPIERGGASVDPGGFASLIAYLIAAPNRTTASRGIAM